MTGLNPVEKYHHSTAMTLMEFRILEFDEQRLEAVPRNVRGYVNGPFGVFQTGDFERAWSVTHLPTGVRIALFPDAVFGLLWIRDVFLPQLAMLFAHDGEVIEADAVRQLAHHYETRGPWG